MCESLNSHYLPLKTNNTGYLWANALANGFFIASMMQSLIRDHCNFISLAKGDKRRAERAQLNSADGDTGEYHDQFYRDHKLLLILFRVLAVMPITRSAPGK